MLLIVDDDTTWTTLFGLPLPGLVSVWSHTKLATRHRRSKVLSAPLGHPIAVRIYEEDVSAHGRTYCLSPHTWVVGEIYWRR